MRVDELIEVLSAGLEVGIFDDTQEIATAKIVPDEGIVQFTYKEPVETGGIGHES